MQQYLGVGGVLGGGSAGAVTSTTCVFLVTPLVGASGAATAMTLNQLQAGDSVRSCLLAYEVTISCKFRRLMMCIVGIDVCTCRWMCIPRCR